MKWKGHKVSTSSPRKSVEDFGVDIGLDFLTGDLNLNGGDISLISGYESFKQTLRNVLLTETSPPLLKFGTAEFLPISDDPEKFCMQCETLARKLITDSTLGHTIEEIHSISHELVDGIDSLFFEMKVTGKAEIITVQVPMKNYLNRLQSI